MPMIEIFCDGSCVNGKGGWGAVLRYGEYEKNFSGSIPGETTSQRAELIAFIEAFGKLKKREGHEIHVHTDSQYLQKGISEWSKKWRINGWKKANGKPVLNKDLWKEVIMCNDAAEVRWHWIRGHSGHPQNEIADKLALRAALKGE